MRLATGEPDNQQTWEARLGLSLSTVDFILFLQVGIFVLPKTVSHVINLYMRFQLSFFSCADAKLSKIVIHNPRVIN